MNNIGGEQESTQEKKLTTIITSREIRKWEQGDLMIKFVYSAEPGLFSEHTAVGSIVGKSLAH